MYQAARDLLRLVERGTSGRSRGVVRSHAAIARCVPGAAAAVHLVPGGTCMRELVPSDRTGSEPKKTLAELIMLT